MHNKLFILATLIPMLSFAQPSERLISTEEYIQRWNEEATLQMALHDIPASITLAQGILESAHGNSALAKYGNNHFGIKCHTWDGETIHKDDDSKNECFRKYHDAKESFEDHSAFLTTRGRYSSLFELKETDYKGWAKGLKKAGYATNPKYADLLINLIEKYDLDKYDSQGQLTSIHTPKNNKAKPESIKEVQPVRLQHVVHKHENNIKFIKVSAGDTYYQIAKEFEMGLWQIYKYNDIEESDFLIEGQTIFLQPKRNKSRYKFHTVEKNESMKDISNFYGIKLKKLYKRNGIEFGSKLTPGTRIALK